MTGPQLACPTGAADSEETQPLSKTPQETEKERNTADYLLVLSFVLQPLPSNWPSLPRSLGSEEPTKYFLWNKSRAGKGKKVFHRRLTATHLSIDII